MLRGTSILKKIAIVLSSIVVVLVFGALTYRFVKTQGVVEDYTVNPEVDSPRLAIVTQKSSFKDEVIRQAIDELRNQEMRIFVTDVTRLFELEDSEWDGMVVLTTVESGQIQEDSHDFLNNHRSDFHRIALFYTADSNSWKRKDIEIDAISSASSKNNIALTAQRIVEESNAILGGLR